MKRVARVLPPRSPPTSASHASRTTTRAVWQSSASARSPHAPRLPSSRRRTVTRGRSTSSSTSGRHTFDASSFTFHSSASGIGRLSLRSWHTGSRTCRGHSSCAATSMRIGTNRSLRGCSLQDCSTRRRASASVGPTAPNPDPVVRLDYVLVGSGVRVRSVTRLGERADADGFLASDHLGIAVELEL